ncbi:FkbM family methyltransferase [Flavobacterium sp.]
MEKIFHLHRLDNRNKIIVLKYLLKRLLHFKTTENEKIINEYFFHLINHRGFLKQEEISDFTASYPDNDVTLKLRKRPSSDLNVFAQIYKYEEYKPLVETFKKYFPERNSLNIIDAGSNIGLTSVYLDKFFPNSTFMVIEPDCSNFESISFNLANNEIKNVVKVKGGLWSKNTYLKIIKDFRDKKDWSIRVEETNEKSELQAFSIPFLMTEYNFDYIDILKMDIEGSEKEVLTSMDANVEFLAKTKCVAIEIHDEFDCREAIYEILKKYNFEFFNSGELTIGVNKNLIKQ